jgi:cytochrome c-type biogenesis protein CcmH/NrfG
LQARAALALARFESLPAEGRAPERRELLGEARAAFEATLAQRPNSRAALIGLGMTYVLEEDADPSAGIEAYRRALASAPREPDCHLGLAKLLMRADQQDSAREHVDFILENYEGQFREEAEQLEKDLDSET